MKTLPLAALFLAVVLFGYVTNGRAQDHQGHRENHDWYRELHQPGTEYSCCNALTPDGEGDCRPWAVWRDDQNRVWTRINGERVLVPPRAILPSHNNRQPLTGHICERNGTIYCALVGEAGG